MTAKDEAGYEELYAELLRMIPIYSREWTNYNNTDPGITILQSLTQLAVWQNNAIAQPNAEIAEKLLALLSLRMGGRAAATVTVGLAGTVASLPRGARLFSGESCYELAEEQPLYEGKTVILCARTASNEIKELSHLLYSGISTFVYPFGEKPAAKMEFYIGLDHSVRVGETLKLYLEMAEEPTVRVPFEAEGGPVFAQLRWEYYTEQGFVPAKVQDDTLALMRSGIVALSVEQEMAAFDIVGRSSFCIRVTLREQQYDCPPKLCGIFCNPVVFEQKRTIATRLFFPYSPHAENRCQIRRSHVAEWTFSLLIRCTDGLWRKCRFDETIESRDQRILVPILDGTLAPVQGEDTLMAIGYQPGSASAMTLGMLYGYDDQKMELPYGGTLADGFETMLALYDEQGQWVFADEKNPDYPYRYHLDSDGSALQMDSAPFSEDNRLIVIACAITDGRKGNIRPQELQNAISTDAVTVVASTQGHGGTDGLTLRDLKEKLTEKLRMPEVPVSEADYERMTRQIPGLRVDRVRAYAAADNIVKIAVQPVSEEPFPHLGKVYIHAIEAYFDRHKLITTRIRVAEPIYLPVDVYLSVQIKPYAIRAQQEIRDVLSREVDYYRSGCDFGGTILYNRLYSRLEQLDCVEYIERMTVEADTADGQAVVDGNDLRLGKCVLPYLRKTEIRQLLKM